MLNNIKSLYFIKFIFVYIVEKKKLKLVKYNKSFQKNLNINLINYKFISGRYIIYESSKIGKEYNGEDGRLIFEGEYLNGARNGKGKEYFDGKLSFEGEYLNGKRNRKGKEYNSSGELEFEGEYLNGKRNRKGKEYYEGGNLKFEGEYLNDKEWIGTRYKTYGAIIYKLTDNFKGTRKEYWYNNKLKFEGEYLNGKRNGKGKGEYINEKRNGKGKEYYENGNLKFEGEYLNDLKWNDKGYNPFNKIIYEVKDGKSLIKEYTVYLKKFSVLVFVGEF